MPLVGCATSVIIMIGLLVNWLESHGYILKFCALMLILNMAMNIHVMLDFANKKEFPQFSKQKQFLG